MKIIFFDDNCLICNGAVRLLNRLDKENQLKYAALHSQTADQLLKNKLNHIDSVIYHKDEEVFIYSEAVIELLIDLGFKVKFLKLIPAAIRDSLYKIVARNRHYFSKDVCPLPTQALREKMLS